MPKKIRTHITRESEQLMLCRQLIINHGFRSQQEIRCALQQHGYPEMSQSTVSRLLTQLDVIKMANARGEKIYAFSLDSQPKPDALSPLSAMVISTDYNEKFVIVYVAAGYARATARVIEHHNLSEILGIVATNNCVWIAPRDTLKTRQLHAKITALLIPPQSSAGRKKMAAENSIYP